MLSTLKVAKKVIFDFLINPFWLSFWVLGAVIISLGLNGYLWYSFSQIHGNITPYVFSSGVIILNLILSNYLWNREKPASLMLLAVSLFIQILVIFVIRFFGGFIY